MMVRSAASSLLGLLLLGCAIFVSQSAAQYSYACVPFEGSPATNGKCDSVIDYSNFLLTYVCQILPPLLPCVSSFPLIAVVYEILQWPFNISFLNSLLCVDLTAILQHMNQ